MYFVKVLLSCLLLDEHSVLSIVFWAYVAPMVIMYLIWCTFTGMSVIKLWRCTYFPILTFCYTLRSRTLRICGTELMSDRAHMCIALGNSGCIDIQWQCSFHRLQRVPRDISTKPDYPKLLVIGSLCKVSGRLMKLGYLHGSSCRVCLCVQMPGLQQVRGLALSPPRGAPM